MKISFTRRLFIYSGALLYIVLDLYVFSGPLRKAIDSKKMDSPESTEEARKAGVIALVLGRPISTSQLERSCQESAWSKGQEWKNIVGDQRKFMRQACLMELIDQQLIRSKIRANKDSKKASDEEINEQLRIMISRFGSREELEKSMHAQGISNEEELRLRVAGTIEQDYYIERQLQPLIAVTEEESSAYYKEHATMLANPLRVHARHVFFATLGKESDAVKQAAEAAQAVIVAKQKTFEQVAAELSEDENSKAKAGDLGWFSTTRLPADFTAPIFALAKNQMALVQTKLGWHIVEMLDRQEATPRTYEQCKAEIIQSLSDMKKKSAITSLRQAIRRDHQQHTHIYQAIIDEMK